MVDYVGKKLQIVDYETSEIIPVEFFGIHPSKYSFSLALKLAGSREPN
jgi:hypothetical protein